MLHYCTVLYVWCFLCSLVLCEFGFYFVASVVGGDTVLYRYTVDVVFTMGYDKLFCSLDPLLCGWSPPPEF